MDQTEEKTVNKDTDISEIREDIKTGFSVDEIDYDSFIELEDNIEETENPSGFVRAESVQKITEDDLNNEGENDEIINKIENEVFLPVSDPLYLFQGVHIGTSDKIMVAVTENELDFLMDWSNSESISDLPGVKIPIKSKYDSEDIYRIETFSRSFLDRTDADMIKKLCDIGAIEFNGQKWEKSSKWEKHDQYIEYYSAVFDFGSIITTVIALLCVLFFSMIGWFLVMSIWMVLFMGELYLKYRKNRFPLKPIYKRIK